MAEKAIVRRYTKALFDLAHQRELVDVVRADLAGVEAVMRAAPRLGRVLRAPTIAPARKRELVRTAFAGRVNDLTLRFLDLVVEKRREEILPDVPEEFQRLAYQMLNIVPVEVTSAVPLTPEEALRLVAALQQRTGKRIELHERVDAALMGGAMLRIGDTVMDGSVRGRLRQLRDRLMAAPVDGRT